MGLALVLLDILQKPSMVDVISELMMLIAPLWIAVIAGILVGWAWKPKWANLGLIDSSKESHSHAEDDDNTTTFTAFRNFFKFQFPTCISATSDYGIQTDIPSTSNSISPCSSSQAQLPMEQSGFVTEVDLEHLCRLVEEKDGGPAWIQMMDRSTPTMAYQAWRRDPEKGPPQYRSRTVYEDVTPEMVRDFFWDDDFRLKWDDMLIYASTLEECPTTGTMVVQWVRKFPFFCSDREYIIGRRIWESGRSYYCITKGVPYTSVPRCSKPKRVDLFYSSWCIRAVESRRGDGQLTACEVILFHHEDMGIPWEIAKLGVRQGMWGAVKKFDPALRAYMKERASEASLSRCAFMAQINTKVSADYLRTLENCTNDLSVVEPSDSSEKPGGRNIHKLLVVGGAIALACSIDKGLLTKAVIFGVARRFAKIGRRL